MTQNHNLVSNSFNKNMIFPGNFYHAYITTDHFNIKTHDNNIQQLVIKISLKKN